MNNKVARALLTTLYIGILAADCIFILNRAGEYRLYTKPLLMPVLYILLAAQTTEAKHKATRLLLILAIFLSFGGDLLLLYDGEPTNFIMGLISFLLAHVSYSLFFIRLKKVSVKRLAFIIVMALIIASYMYLLLSYLWPGISEQGYEVPVVFYAVSLGFMLLSALYTGTGTRILKVAYQNFIPGAILFVISDSLLAIDKFGVIIGDSTAHLYTHMLYAILIITTYAMAQLIIISGAIRIIRK